MGKNIDIRSAYKRVVKILKLAGLPYTGKQKNVIRFFATTYNLPIGVGGLSHLAFLQEQYNNPESPIFRDKKLPVVPLTDAQKLRRSNTKKRKEGKPTTKREFRQRYLDYLDSAKWKSFRNMIKDKRGNKCELCGSRGELHGHHLTYERLYNELETDIQILCKNCHWKIHNK